MSETPDALLADNEVRNEPNAPAFRLRWYVALLAAWPFIFLLIAMVWLPTDAYHRHLSQVYLANTGWGSAVHGLQCDVVVYGDSTAMVGVDPAIITARTNLSVCNIADVAGVEMINGELVLDDFLAHNARPKYLIFLYAPENLSTSPGWEWVSTFEGTYYRFRFHHDLGLAKLFLHHAPTLLGDLELGFRTGATSLLNKPLPPEKANFRTLHNGWVPEDGRTLTACPTDVRLRSPEVKFLSHLRNTYGTTGTKVLIDVTPMPACDPNLPYYRQTIQPGMIDNNVNATLPIEDYTDTGRLHTNHAGVEAISTRLADQIAAAEKGVQ